MSKKIEIEVYEFSELSEQAKKRALDDYIEDNHFWWEGVYDDAEMVDIKIDGFDCNKEFIMMSIGISTPNLILREHGEDCESHIAARKYLEDGNEDELKKSLEAYYLKLLKSAFDDLQNMEYYQELCELNDYYFYKDGKLYYDKK